MRKVVWADLDRFPEVERQETLAVAAEASYYYDLPDVDTFVERCRGAEVIAWSWIDITGEVIDNLPGLKMACFLGVSANIIDLAHARSKGITVCVTPNYGDRAVAEHAVALMMDLARHLAQAAASVRAGRWERFEGTELRGSTLGVVGLGGVGAEIAALGNALGMEVICCTRRPSPERAARHRVRLVELDELLSQSDFVQLALTLNAETDGMIGPRELGLMRPQSYLVNTSRAAIVDQDALRETLERQRIAGYAADVFVREPAYDEPLAKLDNAVLTPHVAFDTPDAKRRMLNIAMDNVLAYLDGRPQNVLEA